MDPSSFISSIIRVPLQKGIRPSSAVMEHAHMDSPARLMTVGTPDDLLTEPANQSSEDSPARLASGKSAGNTRQVVKGWTDRLMERKCMTGNKKHNDRMDQILS